MQWIVAIGSLLGAISGVSAATFTVLNANDTGAGSLRQVILTNNATPPGPNTIAFNISGIGVQTIQPQTPLPAITVPAILDGFTQPGAVTNGQTQGNDGQLMVVLDGSALVGSAHGLYFTGGSNTIKGLVLNQFLGPAIRLENKGENIIQGNFIGTDSSGFFNANPNGVGILAACATNLIGGTTPDKRNLISNNSIGILITSDVAVANAVINNYIGTDPNGFFTPGLANSGIGVQITDASLNAVGFTVPGMANLISGNEIGILISGPGASNNFVLANLIGTDRAVQFGVGNDTGIIISGAPDNSVGSGDISGANIIAGNEVAGISITNGATGTFVQGNFIGVSTNVILFIPNGVGVAIGGASSNLIGGTFFGSGNLIANNDADGIHLTAGASSNLVQGNVIIDNARDGVNVAGNHNTVGGLDLGAGNIISGNARNGVSVFGSNDAILANLIWSNSFLGIDLNADGVNTNDLHDVDVGPNFSQNCPVLTNASSCTGITIDGTLDSLANTEYHLEFFANATCNVLGSGEGENLIGWTNLTADAGGILNFSVTFTNQVRTGQIVTSTATDPEGNTSEFSACLEVDRVRALTVIRSADSNCTAVVTAAELDGGTTDPCGGTNITLIASPAGPYPLGSNAVTLTAMSNTGYTNTGQAAVIVVDNLAPTIFCPTNLIRTAGFTDTNRVVVFSNPPVSDNCPNPTVVCLPPSGSIFPVGTNTINCSATDASGNSNTCSFPLIVLPFNRSSNDLAIVKLKAPKTVTLSAQTPFLTMRVMIQIQNRGPHDEVITNASVLANLVTLNVESLGSCASITPVTLPPKKLPLVVRPKGKLTVSLEVTFNACAKDPAKGVGHEDFRYTAVLNHAAIDGQPDGHPDDDICPRGPLPHNVDPNPDGTIKDIGCGNKNPDKSLGADILTDVILK